MKIMRIILSASCIFLLSSCILLGMYEISRTVRFTEIVKLPDGGEVTVKRKQKIEKFNILFDKGERLLDEELTIIDPETGKKLPAWTDKAVSRPFLLYHDINLRCKWILLTEPNLVGDGANLVKEGYIRYIHFETRGWSGPYEPAFVTYCLNNNNKWDRIPFIQKSIGLKRNLIYRAEFNGMPSIVTDDIRRKMDGKASNEVIIFIKGR
ncbi:MAG: hypothetical protein Q4G42_04970 [Neisseria sp.]|nr:hypothetical protein [Neisseria sp.]